MSIYKRNIDSSKDSYYSTGSVRVVGLKKPPKQMEEWNAAAYAEALADYERVQIVWKGVTLAPITDDPSPAYKATTARKTSKSIPEGFGK
jgi:hypothetical protein